MKNIVGIIRELDKQGRIVIPKEYRERFGLIRNVEIIGTEFGIVLRNPEYSLIKVDKDNNIEGDMKLDKIK